jgi:sugar phosphate isomerase/epimerase
MSRRIGRRAFIKAASALTAATAAFGWEHVVGASRAARSSGTATGRKFSLAYLTVYGCPPPEMTYIAARAGYDFVSFRPIPLGLPGEPSFELAANPTLLKQTRTALASTGLRVLDIELARVADGVDPTSYRPALEVGAELGAKHVISSIWTADRVFATECWGEICDLAKPLGLTVDLEFVTFASVRTLREALDVARAAARGNGGILVDMLHFSRSRVPLADLDAVPRDWFHFVHLCDAPAAIPASRDELVRAAREERLYPGEGGIDLVSILRRIPDVPLSVEVPHLARVRELGYAEHAFRCLESAKKFLAAHAWA